MNSVKKIQHLEQKSIPRQSALYLDYLAGDSPLAEFYEYFPLSKEIFHQQKHVLQNHSFPRSKIAGKIAEHAKKYSCHQATWNNIEKLKHPQSLVLLCGQQPGIFTGPLYTIFKTISTLKLSKLLETDLNLPVIPMFYNVNDDHDLDEIDHIFLLNHHGTTTLYMPIEDRQHCPFGIKINQSEKIKNELKKLLPDLPSYLEFIFPSADEILSDWFTRLMYKLFSAHGLVMIEPALFREFQDPILQTELKNPGQSTALLTRQGEHLKQLGYTPQIVKDSALNFFSLKGLGRQKVSLPLSEGIDYRRVSFALPLRPSLQHQVLPVLAHVCGPGEIAYFAQLKPLQANFGTYLPVIFPRESFTFLENKVTKIVTRWQLDPAALFLSKEDLARRIPLPPDLEKKFSNLRESVNRELSELSGSLEKLQPELLGLLEKTRNNLQDLLQKFESRVKRVGEEREQQGVDQLKMLETHLWPRGNLQERTFNIVYYLARYGLGLLDDLYELSDPFDFRHKILSL